MKVLVLMSTYNGERFLSEQIESVLNQQGVDVHLLIRDDGSVDGTIPLIRHFAEMHPNITLIEGKNCGCARSFMSLVREAASAYGEYDYYAFCDQDDVWMKSKLCVATQALLELPHSQPCLYLGAYQMVDAELNLINTHFRPPVINLPSGILSNAATGCTMVFNRALLEIVASRNPQNIIMHDYWVYLVCLATQGCVLYDRTPYIYYRQHGENVIGGKDDPFMKRWTTRFRKLFLKGDCFKSKLAASLLENYSDRMRQEDRQFLEDVANSRRLRSIWHLARDHSFRGQTLDKNLQTWGLLITGKF